jgi:asparagine synthase (glutamine-hydrolysing)
MSADLRIDNRNDLLARINLSGSQAASHSDADLFMLMFERWGEASFDLLVGDFAIAIWDRQAQELLLARDPLGERPLFYHQAGNLVAFASMPKGLHALPEIARAPDSGAMAGFIGLLPEMGRVSYYAGIEQLAPGSLLRIRASDTRLDACWKPALRDLRLNSFEDHRDAFREQLDRAVRSRLRRRGPVAAHLSAGWDSASVATTAARLLRAEGEQMDALTARPEPGSRHISVRGRITDEGPLASLTAAMHDNLSHIEIEASRGSVVGSLDRHLELFDRPVYGLCNQLWLAETRKVAKARGATLLLTGEYGNFTVSSAPYMLLAEYVRSGRWLDWFREARRLATSGDARLRGVAANSFGPWVPNRLWKAVRTLSSRPEVSAFTAIHPRLALEVEAKREALGIGLAARSSNYVERTLRAITYYDFGQYRKGANAGWDLDERDPTSDRRLLEFCLSLPLDMLLKDGARRPLARAALSDRIPPEVLNEKRKGLQGTDWHFTVSRDLPRIRALVEDIAADPLAASLLDIPALRRWLVDFPNDGGEQRAPRYRDALLNALSAGHFILSASRSGYRSGA